MSRTNLSAVVSRQLPEHIREDYPTFVAFVEAYYEYLQSQGVDFTTIRDIDRTLESFVYQFKKELAYNLPSVTRDERFLLQNIKDQYLAKGSEASYKLLFRLLFGKEVEVLYPGRQMLRASDGRWNQEISLFAKIDYGNAEDVVGKLVDIQTSTRVLRVLVDRSQDIVGEVDRIVLIDPNQQVYEFFLDKKFFGNVSPGDRIKYRDQFQATIIPATQKLTISQPGKDFRLGQVFELRSGTGTGALMKVTAVTDTGGIKYAELIKFGIGYTADFALSVLSENSITSIRRSRTTNFSSLVQKNTFSSSAAGTISASSSSTSVTGSGTNFGQPGGPAIGDELWSTDSTPKTIGVIKSIASTTSLTLVGVPSQYENPITGTYTGSFTFRNARSVGSLYNPGGIQSYTFDSGVRDATQGFDEQGYINTCDWVDTDYVDGTYAGTLLTEFTLNFRNAQVDSNDPAIVEIDLGAIVKYPGYFETNNGFLDDSIYIQDSKYYQAFSYVLKIDERLASYSSAVKTMIHPSGMALFGEFNITNNYDLGIALESLVKSLGIKIRSENFEFNDLVTINFTKPLSDSINTPTDSLARSTSKALSDSINTPTDSLARSTSKALSDSINTPTDSLASLTTKALSNSQSVADGIPTRGISKTLSESQSVLELPLIRFTKPLSDSINTPTDSLASLTTKALSDSLQTPIDDILLIISKGITLSDSIDTPTDSLARSTSKALSNSQSVGDTTLIGFTKALSDSINTPTDSLASLTTKALSDSINTPTDDILVIPVLLLSDSQSILDVAVIQSTKALSDSINTPTANIAAVTTTKYIQDTLDPQTEAGYVGLNSYAGQDMFATEYSVGSRASTFTTP